MPDWRSRVELPPRDGRRIDTPDKPEDPVGAPAGTVLSDRLSVSCWLSLLTRGCHEFDGPSDRPEHEWVQDAGLQGTPGDAHRRHLGGDELVLELEHVGGRDYRQGGDEEVVAGYLADLWRDHRARTYDQDGPATAERADTLPAFATERHAFVVGRSGQGHQCVYTHDS